MRYKTHRRQPRPMPCPKCGKGMGGILTRTSLFVYRCPLCGYVLNLDPPKTSSVWERIAQDAQAGAGI